MRMLLNTIQGYMKQAENQTQLTSRMENTEAGVHFSATGAWPLF